MAETINNTASVIYNLEGSSEVLRSNSNELGVTFDNSQGITIVKSASTNEFVARDIITYTVRITNSGSNFLSGVRIVDDLGGGYLAYVSGSGSLTTSSLTYPVNPVSTSPLTFTLQQLNVGETMTLTYRCQVVFNLPSTVDSITNTVQGTGYTATSTVRGFSSHTIVKKNSSGEFLVTKTANASSLVPNQPFSYYITLTNYNTQTIEVQGITDALPDNFTLTGVTLRIGVGSVVTLSSTDYTLDSSNVFILPSSTGPTITVPANGSTIVRLIGYFN